MFFLKWRFGLAGQVSPLYPAVSSQNKKGLKINDSVDL
jgi:hypothetical protein